jgi:outer membrane protein assembly factor BamB
MRNKLLLCLLFWCGATGLLRAGDWPQLLGPHANGVSDETGLLEKWPAAGPPVLWEKALGTGYGAASVIGGRLVVHHRIGDEEIAECLDARTGASLWRHGEPSRFIDPYGYNNGPRCTPLVTSNRCYTFGAEGKLTCLDLATGALIWRRETGTEWNVPPAFFGVGSSPILAGNLLIVMVGGQPNSGVVALNAATGSTVWESVGAANWEGIAMTGWPGERTVKWRVTDKQASYSTPVAATIHGQRQILCLMRQGLVSLNPTNGSVNFSFWFRAQQEESVNAMNPVVVDDTIFISSAYYKTGSVLLRVKPDNHGVEEMWRGTQLELHWTTPMVVGGYFYAFSGRNEPDARFRCVEIKTGKLMWDIDESWAPYSAEQPGVYGRGSMILADGKFVVLGEGGLLGLFNPNPSRPDEISRCQVTSLRHPSWAAPVLSGKRLYLRSEERLVCLDLEKH